MSNWIKTDDNKGVAPTTRYDDNRGNWVLETRNADHDCITVYYKGSLGFCKPKQKPEMEEVKGLVETDNIYALDVLFQFDQPLIEQTDDEK